MPKTMTARAGVPAARHVRNSAWSAAMDAVVADLDTIDLAFQPQVDLRRGVVAGYEVLARFPGPPHAPPDRWFSYAAERGQSALLEAAVLRRGLEARRRLPAGAFISLNVSPAVLRHPEVLRVLHGSGGLNGVVLELTERQPVDDYPAVRSVLDDLRSRGAMIAVDDAGAGYSSLAHVLALRPEFVKLDRSLVSDVDHDDAKLVAVQMFGELATRIDAWLLAEGTERSQEVEALLRIGVPLAQGYWFGHPTATVRPLGAETVAALRALNDRHTRLTGIGPLIEPTPTAKSAAHALSILREDSSVREVVVVDHHDHPIGLVLRNVGGAAMRPVLLCDSSEDPKALGPRMASRPIDLRTDPALACEENGAYVGVVRLDRIVIHLSA